MSDEDTPTDEEIIANLTQKLEAIKEQLQNYEYFWKCFLHDIRAPAGMIVGSLNLLKNEYSTETSDKQATIIDIAWRGAQRLNNHQKFYSEILSLLHSNAGEFRPEKVKLISVLEEHKVLEIHST
ncbi:MAG: hypothetical protein GY803_14935 [Chloroflexi bacterium]|nr:hypothetical protein [Chloroflexota bacterium]